MPGHDLIVIGASAGGVEALTALVAGLPPDLPAAVCVVMHLRPYGESRLADVLARTGPLPAVRAVHGAPLRPGMIHVAVPNAHLLVDHDGSQGVLRLTSGPRENRNRPAIDPLFRSAALAFGPRTIGVVLSGALDDGTAGLWSIRDRGGLSVVQDPDDALVASMPRSAIDEAGADHVAPAAALGPLLGRLTREPATAATPEHAPTLTLESEVRMAEVDELAHQRVGRVGVPSRFPCPDCGGVLWDVSDGAGPLRYRCETGHAYSPMTLDEAQVESIETTLWASLRAMEDKIALAHQRAQRAAAQGLTAFEQRYAVQEEAAQEHAKVIRMLLQHGSTDALHPRVRGEDVSTGASNEAAD